MDDMELHGMVKTLSQRYVQEVSINPITNILRVPYRRIINLLRGQILNLISPRDSMIHGARIFQEQLIVIILIRTNLLILYLKKVASLNPIQGLGKIPYI